MSFQSFNITLKNGKEITIRPATALDSLALLHLIKNYLDDAEYIPINSEDFNKSEQDISDWINKLNSVTNSLILVAEYNGELIGNLDLTGNNRKTLYHTAVLGMGILTKWRNTGVGSYLIAIALEWTKNSPLEIISLDVYTENKAGIALYKKFGFKEVGVIPNFIKNNNRYYDNMQMWLSIK